MYRVDMCMYRHIVGTGVRTLHPQPTPSKALMNAPTLLDLDVAADATWCRNVLMHVGLRALFFYNICMQGWTQSMLPFYVCTYAGVYMIIVRACMCGCINFSPFQTSTSGYTSVHGHDMCIPAHDRVLW